MLPRFAAIVEALSKAAAVIGAAAVFALLSLVAASVFARYVLNAPLLIGDEVSGYLLVTLGFLGAAEAMRRGRHIRVDVVLTAVSPQVRKWLDVLGYVVGCFTLLAFCWHAFVLVETSFVRGTISPSILATPRWIPQGVMLAGSILFLLQLLIETGHAVHRLFDKPLDR